ncbi:hypothetical protein [Borrelia sp. RT1S]|uniref:hypothetical protein n=1 Tax=Borrelia sp. RT1S TaxID=2898580 RepID=UPI001E37A26E|nr:hypothetical protein [Borrelia sp. RT1S]UGQ17886.1 hypothetical protein LSO05_05490 [Borrelia sp. RT1S]
MLESVKNFFPSNYKGVVVGINADSLSVDAIIGGRSIKLPAVRMIAGGEFDYVPAIGSEVVIGFLDHQFDQPFIIGSLSGVGCLRESLCKDLVSLDSGERRVVIKNNDASTRLILENMNKNIIAIKDAIAAGLDVEVTIRGVATIAPTGATVTVVAPVKGTATGNIRLNQYPDSAINDLFE